MGTENDQTMNMDLAALYGTPGGPSQEDIEKQAQAELFCKLAADNGIELAQLDDAQVQQLWTEVMGGEEKTAADNAEESAAAVEFEAVKQAETEKRAQFEQADYLGRVMAHSMVQELGRIGDNMEKEAKMPEALAKALAKGKGSAAGAAQKGRRMAFETGEKGKQMAEGVKSHAKKYKGMYGTGAAAAGGGAVGAAAGKNKESSAIDERALKRSVEKAAEAGFDPDEAAERLAALCVLDQLGDSEKVAAQSTVDQAVDVRSLELLEKAGYPVTWEE